LNLKEKFSKFSDHWAPRIISGFNDYHIKLAKVQGEFVWHDHKDTDELFLVLDGSLTIMLRDGEVTLNAGEMFIVPKGVEHKPVAESECHILLIEPAGTVNTGEVASELTAKDNVWI
ncbi:MAG: cupin domain-containing protein, partial [Chloroflexi bacterium]|nr:cupin domain-containing protein [Chloroflexota bacterium]